MCFEVAACLLDKGPPIAATPVANRGIWRHSTAPGEFRPRLLNWLIRKPAEPAVWSKQPTLCEVDASPLVGRRTSAWSGSVSRSDSAGRNQPKGWPLWCSFGAGDWFRVRVLSRRQTCIQIADRQCSALGPFSPMAQSFQSQSRGRAADVAALPGDLAVQQIMCMAKCGTPVASKLTCATECAFRTEPSEAVPCTLNVAVKVVLFRFQFSPSHMAKCPV